MQFLAMGTSSDNALDWLRKRYPQRAHEMRVSAEAANDPAVKAERMDRANAYEALLREIAKTEIVLRWSRAAGDVLAPVFLIFEWCLSDLL